MSKHGTDIAKEFSAPSFAEWEEAAKKALKGRAPSELATKTEDGLLIAPLYMPRGEEAPSFVPDSRDFLLRPRIDLPDIDAARAQAMEEIDNGCGGLIITTQGATGQAFGIKLDNRQDAQRFLKDLPAEQISIRLEIGNDLDLAEFFLQAGFARMHTGFDFIGRAAYSGEFSDLNKDFSAVLSLLGKHKPEGAVFTLDTRLYHNAGASEAQELGFALATAAENLRQMFALGLAPEPALRRMSLLLTADARQFISLIKLRAMRLLWARFSEAVSGAPQPVHLSAETSARMLTAKDPHTNLIRNTLAAFAAIIGGAEKVTVLPFTSALGLPDAFARRLARNTLNILREESHLARVQDAARGSSYVEEMTLQLAQAGWKIFQEIEAQGGMIAALRAGFAQRLIAEKREAREKAYRTQEKQIIGITSFADPNPRDVAVLQNLPPEKQGQELALRLRRDAADFETGAAKHKEAAA